MKIAILDDEHTHLQMGEQALVGSDNQWGEGIECRFFSSGVALLEVVKREFFDCLILDRRVSDMSGDVILQWIRQYGEKIYNDYPIVIMLTSQRAEGDVVNSMAMGANDYILKPFRPAELVARVKRALETKRSLVSKSAPAVEFPQVTEHESNELSLCGYTFMPFSHSVQKGDELIKLTEREFSLALLLFRNAGRTLSRQAIFETAWRRVDAGSNRTLDTHIHRIRHQLRLTAENGLLLKPVYGFGYRLDVLSPDVLDATQQKSSKSFE